MEDWKILIHIIAYDAISFKSEMAIRLSRYQVMAGASLFCYAKSGCPLRWLVVSAFQD